MKRWLCVLLSLTMMIPFLNGCDTKETTNEKTTSEKPVKEELMENTLYHVIVLGQSLSMGYATNSCLGVPDTKRAFMFTRVRTQDLGYFLGITKDEYKADPDKYDSQIYASMNPMKESGGVGDGEKRWEGATWNEYETPSSGVAEGLANAYRAAGEDDIPYDVLFSVPGVGGTAISEYFKDGRIYDRALKDVEYGKRLAKEKGYDGYKVLAVVWIQGESDVSMPKSDYEAKYKKMVSLYRKAIKKITEQKNEIPYITYQSQFSSDWPVHSQQVALSQFELGSTEGNGIYISVPCYDKPFASDDLHMTNYGSRALGNGLGETLYRVLTDTYKPFSPSKVTVDKTNVTVKFDREIMLDYNSVNGAYDKELIKENGGFFCFDKKGNEIACTAKAGDDGSSVILTCEKEPAHIYYGFKDPKSDDSYTLGGTVREKYQPKGYKKAAVNMYLPCQIIY